MEAGKDKTDSRLAEPGYGQAVSVQHMTLLFADCMEELKKMQKGYKHKVCPEDEEHMRGGTELLDISARSGELLVHINLWQQYESYWVEFLMKEIFLPKSMMYKFYEEAVAEHHKVLGAVTMLSTVWTYIMGRSDDQITKMAIHKAATALDHIFESVIDSSSSGSLKDKLEFALGLVNKSAIRPVPSGQV